MKIMKIPSCNSKCSSCEKRLCYLLEHSKIYINSLQVFELPKEVKFPYNDMTPFLLPTSGSTNPSPPVEVMNFFRDNKDAQNFSYQAWDWRLMPRQDEVRNLKDHCSLVEKIKDHFTLKKQEKEIKKEDWQYGIYLRSKEDIRQSILESSTPFIEKIKSLEGKEINILNMLPEDCDKKTLPFKIDSTNYYLSFRDITPKSEQQRKSNVASINLVSYDSGRVTSVLTHARLAILEYERR